MEPAVLAGPPAAVSGQEPLPGKVVEESAVRISPSPGGCTDPAQSLESPSRMAEQYRNWGGANHNSEQSDFPIPSRLRLQGISFSVLTVAGLFVPSVSTSNNFSHIPPGCECHTVGRG